MKKYKTTHLTKSIAEIHLDKIKKRGGIGYINQENNEIILEYYFPTKKIVFHGGSNFKTFNKKQIGSAKNELIFGKGFYFTSSKEMAQDFSFKVVNGYVYTCELSYTNPLVLTEKELYKKLFDFLGKEEENTESMFWNNISKKYDVLEIKQRKFGGGMKFSTEYNDFTEYVVYDENCIKIINKESY